jgi:hypothetical protein
MFVGIISLRPETAAGGSPMAWDFQTDPELASQLAWARDIAVNEIGPLDLVKGEMSVTWPVAHRGSSTSTATTASQRKRRSDDRSRV